MESILTQEYIRSILYLDEDGELYWRHNGAWAESPRHRYMAVWIDGVRYYSHRIIFLYVYGYLPKQVEHKHGVEAGNVPTNLRPANQSQNGANADFGYARGVEAHGAKFRARIKVKGKRISLGSYETIEEAIAAYEAGALKYFGEYAYCARAA